MNLIEEPDMLGIQEHIDRLPSNSRLIRILGVHYLHAEIEGDEDNTTGDLYLTRYGVRDLLPLLPGNWYTKEWWQQNRVDLAVKNGIQRATGSVFKIRTKEVDGRSLELVVKNNRVGQELPGGTYTNEDILTAEFNSPLSEFALLESLKTLGREDVIGTQEPLAIFSPSRRLPRWQIGRDSWRVDRALHALPDQDIEIDRRYVTVFSWVEGIDLLEALQLGYVSEDEMNSVNDASYVALKDLGYVSADHKPANLVVHPLGRKELERDSSGNPRLIFIDSELLRPDPELIEDMRRTKRRQYFQRQSHRDEETATVFPLNIRQSNVLGVDYVYGKLEIFDGELWVVGNDPDLFEYFLPEKWMISPRAKLSTSRDIYMTRTTDGINLVWKTSNVGKFPSEEPLSERDLLLNGHGYNSPFEEVAISEELRMMGLPTVNMRAIYRTSLSGGLDEESFDTSRFESHGGIYGPFGEPVLKPGYRYITFWGVTTDSEEGMGMTDEDYHGGLNLTHALRNGVVDVDTYRACVEKEERKLRECGYLDLNVRGGNYLLSYDADGNVINDGIDGLPVLQIANLELISRINGHV
ncbi:MAG: hypothetical protein QF824_02160 [Candidatus Woesearchaeota archaeon]|jgi:hypothetical protein|nr:hypothetical protein [Candidatus Woesearchaeota archaeon]